MGLYLSGAERGTFRNTTANPLRRQVISNHGIKYTGWTGTCFSQGIFSTIRALSVVRYNEHHGGNEIFTASNLSGCDDWQIWPVVTFVLTEKNSNKTYDDTSSDSLSKQFDVKLFSKKWIMKPNHCRDAFME